MRMAEKLAMAAEALNKESSHQRALFAWAAEAEIRERYPELKWLYAIPNGGERPKPVAAAMKAEGAKDGVSDMHLPVKRGEWSGLYIELKRPAKDGKRAGQASVEQREFQEFVRSQGYGASICYGWEAARDMLIKYLEYKDE